MGIRNRIKNRNENNIMEANMNTNIEIMATVKVIALMSCMNLVTGSHADVVTLRFNMGDLLAKYSQGGLMSAVNNPRRISYKSSAADGYSTWGATYADSAVDRYDPNDPDFPTALGNYQAWLATNPKVSAFNLSLRPYAGSQAWGQQLMLASPPTSWTSGTDAQAAPYFTTSAASGWNSEVYWSSWSGPTVGFSTTNLSARLSTTADAWFEITGDFMMDTDYDGVADTAPKYGDSMRFWVGTVSADISTTTNEWTSLGVTGLERAKDPQLNGVMEAQVIPEPSGILLLIMGSGSICYGRKYYLI